MGEDVKKRIEMWNARVERAQRITGIVRNKFLLRGYGAHTEEHILKYYRLLCETKEVVVPVFVMCERFGGCFLFYARPGEVDIEEEEENAKSYYRWLLHISFCFLFVLGGRYTSN
jgi:hypothetical protein